MNAAVADAGASREDGSLYRPDPAAGEHVELPTEELGETRTQFVSEAETTSFSESTAGLKQDLGRFDTSGDGSIGFLEVVEGTTAFNSGPGVGGQAVSFGDTIRLISAFGGGANGSGYR